jgi:hypothetical protein
LFDRLAHEALVVTGAAEPDEDESEAVDPDEDEPEEDEPGADTDEPDEDVLTGVELEVVEMDACVVFWLASAGS